MRRSIDFIMAVTLLSGCATFSESGHVDSRMESPDRDTIPVSPQQMHLLLPDDWYAVRLPESDGWSSAVRGVFHSGYVGRLQKSNEDSLTLTEVTKCTNFDSKSALRRLPLIGSSSENGWLACKNEPGTITVARSKVMWFEPISAENADKFRRYDEIMNRATEFSERDDSDSLSAQFGALDNHMPNVDFLLPNPRSEEIRSRRWLEVREMRPGQWYTIIPRRDRGTPNDLRIHVGVVDHVDENSVRLTNVTTGSALGSRIDSEVSTEMTHRLSQIDRVMPLTPEQAAEQIAVLKHRRDAVD